MRTFNFTVSIKKPYELTNRYYELDYDRKKSLENNFDSEVKDREKKIRDKVRSEFSHYVSNAAFHLDCDTTIRGYFDRSDIEVKIKVSDKCDERQVNNFFNSLKKL